MYVQLLKGHEITHFKTLVVTPLETYMHILNVKYFQILANMETVLSDLGMSIACRWPLGELQGVGLVVKARDVGVCFLLKSKFQNLSSAINFYGASLYGALLRL